MKIKLKAKPVKKAATKNAPNKPPNIFGIGTDTMLLTDTGRLTKAGFILEFHKLRTPFCVKLFDEVKAALGSKAFMISEQVHLDLLLKSFDRICISVYSRKDKVSIADMKATITKNMREIQDNIVNNIVLVLPDL